MARPLYIFDIDGTLADNKHRAHLLKREPGSPPDWNAWYKLAHLDTPRTAVVQVLNDLLLLGYLSDIDIDNEPEIWFFTGRPEEHRELTVNWLVRNTRICRYELAHGKLVMRATSDYRPDYVVKQEMVDRMLDVDRERLVCVFDDRQQVVDMWRKNGINCFQVQPGDY